MKSYHLCGPKFTLKTTLVLRASNKIWFYYPVLPLTEVNIITAPNFQHTSKINHQTVRRSELIIYAQVKIR